LGLRTSEVTTIADRPGLWHPTASPAKNSVASFAAFPIVAFQLGKLRTGFVYAGREGGREKSEGRSQKAEVKRQKGEGRSLKSKVEC
jgi:hypothetical protein